MRDDRERLLDILEAIERIEKYAAHGRQAFETDELIQSWIVNHLRILREAARTLSPQTQQQFPTIPWSKIIGMRHILIIIILTLTKRSSGEWWRNFYRN